MKRTQNARLKHLTSIMTLTFVPYGLVMDVAHRLRGENIIRFIIINGLYI